jgi:GDPmannose 4,6-dehydratase
MKPRAFVTGIAGMDGFHLAPQLAKLGYEVFGLVRRNSQSYLGNFDGIGDLPDELHFIEGDVLDLKGLQEILASVQPQLVFNLAAQSHVGTSYHLVDYTLQVTGIGAINVIRACEGVPGVRIYQASSSEMFGATDKSPQNEETTLAPISPYAIAKTMAHHYAEMMRKRGMFVSCGILFNHESEYRGANFLTQKVARAAAFHDHIKLGNLDAIRDWGYAPEYTKGMISILLHDIPDTFVLATGQGHTVEEFVRLAYDWVGLNYREYCECGSADLVRPIEAGPLVGDYSKANRILKWKPKTTFPELIGKMVDFHRY